MLGMHIVHLLVPSLCICCYITLHYSSNILLQIEEVFAFSNFCLYIIWKLVHRNGWASKNWCFWIVVLEKTLESPLDCKEVKQSVLKELNPEYSLEGLLLKLKLQYFGHLMWNTTHWKRPWCRERLKAKEKEKAEDKIASLTDSKYMNLSKL